MSQIQDEQRRIIKQANKPPNQEMSQGTNELSIDRRKEGTGLQQELTALIKEWLLFAKKDVAESNGRIRSPVHGNNIRLLGKLSYSHVNNTIRCDTPGQDIISQKLISE